MMKHDPPNDNSVELQDEQENPMVSARSEKNKSTMTMADAQGKNPNTNKVDEGVQTARITADGRRKSKDDTVEVAQSFPCCCMTKKVARAEVTKGGKADDDGSWSTVVHKRRSGSIVAETEAEDAAKRAGKRGSKQNAAELKVAKEKADVRKFAALGVDTVATRAKYGPDGNMSLEQSTPFIVRRAREGDYEAKLTLALNVTTLDPIENMKVRTMLKQMAKEGQSLVGLEYHLIACAALSDVVYRGAGGDAPDEEEARSLASRAMNAGLEDLARGENGWGGTAGPGDKNGAMRTASGAQRLDADSSDVGRTYPGGHAWAQYRLGWLYFQGLVPFADEEENLETAQLFWGWAAEQGHVLAKDVLKKFSED